MNEDAEFYYLQSIDDGEAICGECESCGRKNVMVVFTEYEIDTLNGPEERDAWWCVDWSKCVLEDVSEVEMDQVEEPELMEMY